MTDVAMFMRGDVSGPGNCDQAPGPRYSWGSALPSVKLKPKPKPKPKLGSRAAQAGSSDRYTRPTHRPDSRRRRPACLGATSAVALHTRTTGTCSSPQRIDTTLVFFWNRAGTNRVPVS